MSRGSTAGLRTILRKVGAPVRLDELAVVAVSQVVPRQVAPEIAGGRVIHVRDTEIHRHNITHEPLEIVTALFAAISDLPRLLVVIAGDGGGRPDVTVARNFAAVVEVVKDAELPRQGMLVRCDVFAV